MSQGYNVQTLPNFRVQDGFPVDIFPIGMITPFAGMTGPYGWLICNGAEIQRDLYPSLFKVIGTYYGNGDGVTTFNLPNFIGRVPVGLDQESAEFPVLGATGGEKYHTLNVNEIPSHNHGGTTSTNGSHIHDLNNATTVQKSGNNTTTALDNSGGEIDNVNTLTASVVANGDHAHSISSQGGGNSHNNIQPYLTVNYIIKY